MSSVLLAWDTVKVRKSEAPVQHGIVPVNVSVVGAIGVGVGVVLASAGIELPHPENAVVAAARTRATRRFPIMLLPA
jgi:hypothetical protein